MYGVFISYNLIFNKEKFERFFTRNGLVLALVSLAVISVAPLVKNIYFSAFQNALLYASFGNILLLFLTGVVSFSRIKNPVAGICLSTFSKIGVYSYSIYLFHPVIRDYIIQKHPVLGHFHYSFLVYLVLSIMAGIVFTKIIEFPMLALREKYFPARK
jgi:peptidoglycan/LPS O-acetylase OafA/YrhL